MPLAHVGFITGAIVVAAQPWFARLDEKGAFRIDGVPEGKYTLKVCVRGQWVHQQAIEVTGRGADVGQVRVPAPPGKG